MSEVERGNVRIRLVDGGIIEMEMSSDELAKMMRTITDGKPFRTTNEQEGFRLWIRSEHVISVQHPPHLDADWGVIHDEALHDG